jgi:iron complex transport system permease protein
VHTVRPLTPRRVAWICAGLGAVLLAAAVISLRMGAYPISVTDIVRTLFSGVIGRWDDIPSGYRSVVFEIRLPRILLGILVGASLSTAGCGFQALLRNPLADPYVLGVSSGAALGAIISLIAAPHTPGAIQLAAFAGAAATTAAVYFLGRRGGQLDGSTLPTNPLPWFEGLFLVFVLAAGAIYATSSDLNLILTGEQEARHLGVNVHRVKLVVYISASVLTGLAVSVSGTIGYVGLLVPHVMRMMFGTDYRLLIPTSAIGGAILVLLADTLARSIVSPTELPVGAMTALAGAPVFIYLMRRRVR